MNFQILQQSKIVGQVNKEWFTWGDSYKVQILDEEMKAIVIAHVVAIDCVKSDQTASTAAANN